MNTRILGLDTGTNSLAWAVVDRDVNGDYTLVRRGDVIFTEGVNVDGQPVPSKAAVKIQIQVIARAVCQAASA